MNVSYKHLEKGPVRDAAALKDIADYFGDKLPIAENIAKSAEKEGTAAAVQQVNMALGFAGVEGFPFHAFCRAHCPTAYAKWLEDDNYK